MPVDAFVNKFGKKVNDQVVHSGMIWIAEFCILKFQI